MRNAWWCLLGVLAADAAEGREQQVSLAEPQPVALSGFAVGQAGYDRALKANGFTAGKIALSLFKPVGDAYFFGQLTTASANGATSTAIDNLIVSWTPAKATRWSFVFERFHAPLRVGHPAEPPERERPKIISSSVLTPGTRIWSIPGTPCAMSIRF